MKSSLELLDAAYARACRMLDRFPRGVPLVLTLWVLAVLIVLARGKWFWHDEVVTVLLADLPLPAIWRASLDGADLSAPLNTMVTHMVHAVAGVGPVATRLSAMLGFTIAVGVVFVVVRRRSTVVVAITAGALTTLTGAWSYAYEARGYGLAAGLFALALYGWVEAAAGRAVRRHLVIMAAALAAGVWTHYFFVLAYVPIALGESTRQLLWRRFDRGPWLALLASGAAALPVMFLAGAAAAQRRTFWAQPRDLEFRPVYQFLLGRIDSANPRLAARVLLVLVVIEVVRRARSRSWRRHLPGHEVVAGMVCLCLPAYGVLLGQWTGVFHERYLSFFAVGFAMTLPLALWCLTPSNGLGDLLACLVVLHGFANLTEHALRDPPPVPDWLTRREGVMQALARPGPLVVNGATSYLPLWYYAPTEARARLIYLADPESQAQETGTDTIDRGYLALARWSSLSARPLADFVRTHEAFHMYSLGTDWVETSLGRHGAVFTEVRRDAYGRLYEVRW